jgi:hypothetical protein
MAEVAEDSEEGDLVAVGAVDSGVGNESARCAKSKAKSPHPDPLPSDGRGNSSARFGLNYAMVCNQRVNPFSLSHPMGEGRGEGFSLPVLF